MQATFVVTNLPTRSLGRWLSGLGFLRQGGGGGLPKPISKQREKNRRQTPSVRAQPWGLQCKQDAMAGAVFLFGKLPPPGCIDSQM